MDRLLTYDQLHKGNVYIQNLEVSCYFYIAQQETTSHLVFSCPEALFIWYGVFKWMGIDMVIPQTQLQLFDQFSQLLCQRKEKSQMETFTLACNIYVWCMWNARNNIIFLDQQFDGSQIILAKIKTISWQWFLYKRRNKSVIFYST